MGSSTVTVSSRQIFSTDGGFTNLSVTPTSDGCRNPLGAEKGCQFSAPTGGAAVAFTCRSSHQRRRRKRRRHDASTRADQPALGVDSRSRSEGEEDHPWGQELMVCSGISSAGVQGCAGEGRDGHRVQRLSHPSRAASPGLRPADRGVHHQGVFGWRRASSSAPTRTTTPMQFLDPRRPSRSSMSRAISFRALVMSAVISVIDRNSEPSP